ncbi:tetratricopeptide repeat-containing diguanylate cyclase [Niveibacterium microcysteis]|uniref:diguanylate cyclase n=1 Tax=Niveibacterium microcysteis TaxID=2811415 RepID=A0ABX7M2J9_9RHOO|nr:tetratricopeptide repeat-containing diguanylate cyclase [Niveibacterium microcysteis]QSI75995.1 GGDEF domain-containing protein [Niveibacterium microcysteis]
MPQTFRSLTLAALLVALAPPSPAADAPEGTPATLVEQARANVRLDPEASRRYADAALEALKRAPDADLEVAARLVLCDYQGERSPQAAQSEIDAANALLPKVRRRGLRAGVLACEGQLLELANKTHEALAKYDEAAQFAEGAQDAEMLADALYQRGYIRALLGQYAEGLVDQRRALALYEKLHLRSRARTAVNGIAILYNRMGDYAQAKHYYLQSLKGHIAEGARREQAVTLHNLGRAHENLGEWSEARQAFEQSLAIHNELGYPRGAAYAHRGLASVCNALGDARCADAELNKAEADAKAAPDARLRAQIQLQRGITLRLQKRYPESIAVLLVAAETFASGDSLAELRDTYRALAASYAESSDWRAAYERLVEFKNTSDTLLLRQLDQRFATLKVEFDTASKDQENALLTREKAVAERALAQERTVGRLQAAVIALATVLTLILATLLLRHRRTSRHMEALAHTDELTGLPNRRDILNRLGTLLRAAEPQPCAVLIADLDHFKPINDQYGHLIGDEILKVVAQALNATVRAPACVGRIGGEEFLILLPDTALSDAIIVAERLREQIMAIDATRWFADRPITASFGLTTAVAGDTVSTMLRRADEALYEAKDAGRNRVTAHCA